MSASLGPVREVWAHRSRARSRGDRVYLMYLVAMTALVVGVPLLLSTGRALARPDVLPLLLGEGALPAARVLALALGAALVLAGGVRGPALLPPFFVATLASGPLPRGLVLRRPVARALLLPVLAAVIPALLVGATLLPAVGLDTPAATLLVLTGLGTGLLWGTAWCVGQLLRPTGRRLLALALGVAAVVGLLGLPGGVPELLAGPTGSPGSAADAGTSWRGPSATVTAALVAAGGLGVATCFAFLDRLRGDELAAQAARWEIAATTATTLDLAATAGALRAVPSGARRAPAIGPGPLPLLYARRDAVAWLRTPDRCASGVVGALLGAAAIAGTTGLTGPVAWVVLLLGTLLLHGATGAFVDGIRHAVHTLGAPPLLGQRAGTQMVLHAVAPLVLLLVLAALGGLAVTAAGGASGPAAVLLPVGTAVVVLASRAWDAAKGTMPLSLATPIPTPQGDLSVLVMLAWQADAVIVPLLAAALLLAVLPLGQLAVLGVAAALAALLGLLTARRLRALES